MGIPTGLDAVGDVDYRFTMGVEDKVWKITGVCDILSEGCFAVNWG
jgi:hypothetical protein